MNILILGVTGMLGKDFFLTFSNIFQNVYGTARKLTENHKKFFGIYYSNIYENMDVNNIDNFKNLILSMKPEIIINCIGMIKQKKENIDNLILINSKFPKDLYHIATLFSAKVINISTDCVFSGIKGKYTDKEIPDPVDFYGLSKYLGEIPSQNYVNIRTSIIGFEINNKYGLLEWFFTMKGKSIDGYKNAIWTGFSTIDLSEILADLVKNDVFQNKYGIFHLASSPINKYDLLSLINQNFNLKIEIKEEYDVKINRSLISSDIFENYIKKYNNRREMVKRLLNNYNEFKGIFDE